MKIYFGSSTSQFDKYKEQYLAIRDFAVKEGHIITRDWVQMHRDNLLHHPEKLLVERNEPERIYKKATKALFESDIMIAENTVPSFSNGHLMTLALQQKKPVLVLLFKDRPKRYLKKSFIEGITSENLELQEYTMQNYQSIIRSFLSKYEDSFKKHRFHLVIDNVEKRYLDWAGHRYKKSKTKIIRDGLRQVIDGDEDYGDYLGTKNV